MGVLGRSFGRYRPYVTVVVAVVLIAFVPARARHQATRSSTGVAAGVTDTTAPPAPSGGEPSAPIHNSGTNAAATAGAATATTLRSPQAATTRTPAARSTQLTVAHTASAP